MTDPSRPPRPSHPTSMPPEVSAIDHEWDDETVPRFDLDDPMADSAFDRVTAIPELPADVFAKQVMEESDPALLPPEDDSSRVAAARSDSPDGGLDPMGLVTAPQPDESSAATGPLPPRYDPTGLELADTNAPNSFSGPSSTGRRHDPRDPVLELDLGDIGPPRPFVPFTPPPPTVRMPPAPLPPAAAPSGPPASSAVPASSGPASLRRGPVNEMTEMKDRYAMGDFTGALAVAESLLSAKPDDAEAQRYATNCREVLTQMYSARLGSLSQHVRVAVPSDQIRWLSLDHRAGFVLSLIDGSSTLEELLDICGMNRLDALRILYTLFDQRVIALG